MASPGSPHLAEAQFHQREGRPTKRVHSASGEDNSSAPKRPHVHVHSPGHVKKRGKH